MFCRDGNLMMGPNVWRDDLPGFRPAIYGYYEQVLDLGHVLFKAFALTLGIAEGFFEDKIDKPMSQLRLIYYPTRHGPVGAVPVAASTRSPRRPRPLPRSPASRRLAPPRKSAPCALLGHACTRLRPPPPGTRAVGVSPSADESCVGSVTSGLAPVSPVW